MPVVPCPHCSKPVSLPPDWTGTAYTCPHCRRVVSTSEAPEPPTSARPPRSSASRQSVSPPPPPPAPLPPPPPAREPREQEEPFDIDPTPRRRRNRSTNPIIDFVTFRLMITPVLIQIVFWFGVLVCIGQGLSLIFASFTVAASTDLNPFDERITRVPGSGDRPNFKETAKRTFSFGVFALGVGVMIMGPLMVRLYCELLIVIFKIHDELKLSNDRQRYRL